MSPGSPAARPPSYDKKIGLVLQGGGALGSYQAGVFEALASSEYLPDWVAGISIGAINAAIIAGSRPENRDLTTETTSLELGMHSNITEIGAVDAVGHGSSCADQ
ncbi:MAG TPA: patatin-like phospholipase family protein [Xanthobacteraceae bacterium]|nr:patatin-like phospholipase family protein [Xanthobacteraceae bacterium]